MVGKLLGAIAAVALALGMVGGVSADRCADFDHDGVVTEADVGFVTDRYGTYPGSQPNSDTGLHYSWRYDLNGDRRIDISDIIAVVRQIGAEC